ncbi:hypothetical protein [Aequorivita vitellina]|nr:hypothetical protein [Aequorivita vitellina]
MAFGRRYQVAYRLNPRIDCRKGRTQLYCRHVRRSQNCNRYLKPFGASRKRSSRNGRQTFWVGNRIRDAAEEFEIHPATVKIGTTYNGFSAIENTTEFKPDSKFLTKGGFVLLKEEGGGGHSL